MELFPWLPTTLVPPNRSLQMAFKSPSVCYSYEPFGNKVCATDRVRYFRMKPLFHTHKPLATMGWKSNMLKSIFSGRLSSFRKSIDLHRQWYFHFNLTCISCATVQLISAVCFVWRQTTFVQTHLFI